MYSRVYRRMIIGAMALYIALPFLHTLLVHMADD